jgi:hypothetical protein
MSRVSSSDWTSLIQSLELMLCRLIVANRVKFDPVIFWESSWHDEYMQAVRVIRSSTERPFAHHRTRYIPIKVSEEEQYSLRISLGCSGLVNYIHPEPMPIERASKLDPTFDLLQWMRQCHDIETEVRAAYSVLIEVVNMASTAGQLQRMVPDLMRYLPAQYSKQVSNQRRRSSLPALWYHVDRARVRAATNTIAKCYLLPKIESLMPNQYSELNMLDEETLARRVPATCATFNREGGWTVGKNLE